MLPEIENDEFLRNLPQHFKDDLERVLKYDRKIDINYDCYLDELWSSIHICEGLMSPAQAEELRQKYYWPNIYKGLENEEE